MVKEKKGQPFINAKKEAKKSKQLAIIQGRSSEALISSCVFRFVLDPC